MNSISKNVKELVSALLDEDFDHAVLFEVKNNISDDDWQYITSEISIFSTELLKKFLPTGVSGQSKTVIWKTGGSGLVFCL